MKDSKSSSTAARDTGKSTATPYASRLFNQGIFIDLERWYNGIPNMTNSFIPAEETDDALETEEWLGALTAVVRVAGRKRASRLLHELQNHAIHLAVPTEVRPFTAYRNTIPEERQVSHPGDVALEQRLTALMRWNALAMVVRANRTYGDLGGHIASYASAAEIFEIGFNHFFRGPDSAQGGDLVYFQAHSAPGIYARAFLEDRLEERQLARYRQEIGGQGLCSYPHPWLMPSFWQFPSGSMGIGPINAIYQARLMRYLQARSLAATDERRIWGVFGDGEMDEPESIGALTLAARERLDNLTFIINCNLQRLDGPVRGNGQIIQELESLFVGAGWNVIKVLWGSNWDPLFARDTDGVLSRRLAETVDGQYQTLGAQDGSYNLLHFFSSDPNVKRLVAHLSPADIDGLNRGGHDLRKLYAAFESARQHRGQPTVILAKTKKGYGLGRAGESRMTSHQQKRLATDTLRFMRDRFKLPLTDKQVDNVEFYRPPDNTPEMQYLKDRRAALGGALPARRSVDRRLTLPPIESYAQFALCPDGRMVSTTMIAVRLLSALLKDKAIGSRIVPIVADEARTFGMDGLFRQIGIYAADGQLYEPEDAGSLLSYREKRDGQLLQEGITEAGALSSWTAAATAYSVHNLPLLPFYLFYSMFGFQRVGDFIWAAADQRARGFLIGATSGRTTLGGEGLQHQDGTSQLIASTIPNCKAYDPAFAGELAVILDHGAREMLEEGNDVFYYITVMNENYEHPKLPPDAHAGVIKGMYLYAHNRPDGFRQSVHLLGSGAILREVIAAAERLAQDWNVASDVWSVTSFSELAREAREVERHNRLNPVATPRVSYVAQHLSEPFPVIAATDYVVAYPQLISPYITSRLTSLGTDGFGRSDTRSALRKFFEVDCGHVVIAALASLGMREEVANAIQRYGIEADSVAPWKL
jgi:pyruvate dehydrogenase E1 component